MIDYIKRVASATAKDFRRLLPNAIPFYHLDDTNEIGFKGGDSIIRRLVTRPGPAPANVTAATLAVTAALHDGKLIVLSRAGGITATLPAATGSGARYKFLVNTALSAASHVIQVANANDYMRGISMVGSDDSAGAIKAFNTADTGTVATESDTITLDGSTKSGFPGTNIELVDMAANVWAVQIEGKATGTEASPFSVAV